MIIYVNANAAHVGNGTKEHPYRSIQEAADIAVAGDEVLVLPGIYRENVNPKNGGTAEHRIIYRSVEPGAAVITGAEPLTGWRSVSGTVWTARVHNAVFGSFNPYTTLVSGDWFIASMVAHTGDIYLNGKSLYEAETFEGVLHPQVSEASWDPQFSIYTWYSEQDGDETVFYANFQGKNPNEETVEYSVRPCCFAPKKEGVGYITLSGFTVCMAATQWAPPTAYQEGMIAPHWSKGWIIENCDIYESKCCGISLGKHLQEGNNNKWLHWKYKDGTQTQRECVCLAQVEGWSKETVGSHFVRHCEIHNCGQAGIVGHLGGVFSIIEDCHIYHINTKQNLAGAETGGIKLHAAIDTVIRRCHIHHCMRGLWLDWQAQGTRVTQNLFHDNTLPFLPDTQSSLTPLQERALGEDIFVEVSHGPTLIDNNVLLSERALKLACQGIAVVHNMIAGALVAVGIGTDNGAKTLPSPRYTPYHLPHSTVIAGFMTFLHGDARFYSNLFVQRPIRPAMKSLMVASHDNPWDDGNIEVGTFRYNGYPTFAEWDREFDGYCGMGSAPSDRYYMHLPVWTGGNVFFNGAKPWEKESDYVLDTENNIFVYVEESQDGWHLITNLYQYLPHIAVPLIATEKLGVAFEPEQRFENIDGTALRVDHDYLNMKRPSLTIPGPFADAAEIQRAIYRR